MKILFMGTPEYAIEPLKAVYNKHEIVGVLTRADKPNRRGNKIEFSPVKKFAEEHNIPVFQPEKMKDENLINELKKLNPDISVVVAYGMMIPSEIINLAKYSTINVHGSLLPKYRGAAPMQYSVLNGDDEAGVTIMYVTEKLDSGDIILSKSIKIGENETFGEVHDRLSVLGAEALIEAVDLIEKGEAVRTKQNDEEATFAPSISKDYCRIDWTKSAQEVHNKIRGLSPIPCSNTLMPNGKILKIYRSEIVSGYTGDAGTVIDNIKKKGFVVMCGADTSVCITSAKPEGKKEMPGFEIINGHYLKAGDRL